LKKFQNVSECFKKFQNFSEFLRISENFTIFSEEKWYFPPAPTLGLGRQMGKLIPVARVVGSNNAHPVPALHQPEPSVEGVGEVWARQDAPDER
jgi:hypothetical protein